MRRRRPDTAGPALPRRNVAPAPGEQRYANRDVVTLLVCLVALTTFAALFVLRVLDDNHLTSWSWAFDQADVRLLVPVLAAAVALAYAVSGVRVPAPARIPLLFTSALAAATLFWGIPEVVVDTGRYVIQAKYLALHGPGTFLAAWGREIPAWTDLPLASFLYGLVFRLFGETRMAVQATGALLYAGSAALTWLIGRALWDDTVGGAAAGFLLASPYLLVQQALMLADIPTMFFLTLAVYATLRAVREGGTGTLAAAAAAIALALLSKYSVWLMLSVVPIIVLVHPELGWRRLARRAAVVALGSAVLMAPFLIAKFDVVRAQIELLWSYQLPGLGRWHESHVSTFLFQVHPFVTVAALCSLAVAVRRQDPKYAIVAWMPLLLLAIGVHRARYMVIALPMLALMAGYTLREVADGRVRRLIVGCAVVSSLVTGVLGYVPLLKGMSAVNLMAAGAYLDGLDVDAVEVHVLPQPRSLVNPGIVVPILDLFTHKRIIYHERAMARPDAAAIATSPLRFTWAYRAPSYYRAGAEIPARVAVAVIGAGDDPRLPPDVAHRVADMPIAGEFAVSDEFFRFQTLVRIFGPPQ